ncbi:hypothetical protein BD01_0808 [Thermococcus nautili]|uniref:Uncharacterized protein n=1 Tax=Thermococcus nautili TaxID=195522 RepID=W8P4P1_9EURY|nr:hypothetical protein BD01_0808 [Thermococcus nautili]
MTEGKIDYDAQISFNSPRVLLQQYISRLKAEAAEDFQFSSSLIATSAPGRQSVDAVHFQFSSSLIATKLSSPPQTGQLPFQFSSSLIATNSDHVAADVIDFSFNSPRVLLQPSPSYNSPPGPPYLSILLESYCNFSFLWRAHGLGTLSILLESYCNRAKARTLRNNTQIFQFSSSLIATLPPRKPTTSSSSLSILLESYCNSLRLSSSTG